MAIQLLRFVNAFKDQKDVWINPEQIVYAETGIKNEDGKKTEYTLLHVTGKEGKVFVKEKPEEINAILRKHMKKEVKIELP